MRNYLIFSSSAHFIVLAALFVFARGAFTAKKPQHYYIDFIGQGKVVTVSESVRPSAPETARPASPAVPAKTPKKTEPAAEIRKDDAFSTSKKPSSEPLPPPSVLNGAEALISPAAAEQAEQGGEGSPLLADFSDFPYPWYIAQVREALWNSWTRRMPSSGALKCTVRFDIRRNGTVKSVGVENSSGNRLFDYAAESSVESSAPFPRLPDDFFEDVLTVHVEFKTTE